jgi:single-strand DNA-binding protein
MANLNQCSFIGTLGADPEVRQFPNGGSVCNLRLAVSETWKDKETGEKKERTEWVPVTLKSDGLCRIASQYLKKGSKVFVQGKFETRNWTDKDGGKRYSTEISLTAFSGVLQILGDRGNKASGQSDRGRDYQSGYGPARNDPGQSAGMDDEIPF